MSINQVTKLRLPDGTEVAFVDWSDKPLYSTADLLAGFQDQELALFQYTSGDPVASTSNITVPRNSTDRDTNMATPGSNASTEEMLVYALRPEVFEFRCLDAQGAASTNANNAEPFYVNQPQPSARRLAVLQSTLMIILEITQKWAIQAGFGYFNSGMGVNSYAPVAPNAGFVFAAPAALAPRTAATQGLPGQGSVRSMVIPVHIGGQEKWRCHIDNFSGAAVQNGILDLEANPATLDAAILHQVRIYLDGLYKRPVA